MPDCERCASADVEALAIDADVYASGTKPVDGMSPILVGLNVYQCQKCGLLFMQPNEEE